MAFESTVVPKVQRKAMTALLYEGKGKMKEYKKPNRNNLVGKIYVRVLVEREREREVRVCMFVCEKERNEIVYVCV